MKKKKPLFVFYVDNTIDLITNSSSELFVLKGDTKENVIEMIKTEYPDYLNEYDEVEALAELSDSHLETYLSYAWENWNDKLGISKKFDIDPTILYSNFEKYGTKEYWYGRYSEEGMKILREKLVEKLGNCFFLFSIDDNPNWEMQEKLENLGSRYHLG